MAVILELVNRGRRVIQRYKMNAAVIRIGRAYDNDIILDEPHVSPHHAELRLDESGQWFIHDLNSTNGIRYEFGKPIRAPRIVSSGEVFSLGRAHLRLMSIQHPIPDTVPLTKIESLLVVLSNLWVVVGLTLLMVSWFALRAYMEASAQSANSEIIQQVLMALLVVLVWAGLWGFFGRVLRHEARFLTQLSVVFLCAVGLTLVEYLGSLVGYNFLSLTAENVIVYAGEWFLFGALFYLNLMIATHLRPIISMISGATLAALILCVPLLFHVFDEDNFSHRPNYVEVLRPPILKFTGSMDRSDFFERAPEIFEHHISSDSN